MLEIIWDNFLLSFTVLLLVYLVYLKWTWAQERRSIARLGSFATYVHSFAPWGIDIAARTVRHSLRNTDLQHWSWLFSHGQESCNTVEFHAAGQRFIMTADPENMKAILATQFSDYGKGEVFHREWNAFLGDSIFTTDGDLWHSNRQLIRPQFIKERVRDLDIFEEYVQKLISRLGGQGQRVDISELFYRYTLDAATDYLLGESVGSLDRPQAEFAEAFAHVQQIQDLVARVGPLNFLIPRIGFKDGIQKINAFVEPFIDSALKMNPNDLKEVQNQTFLQAMAVQGVRDRKMIRDQVVAVLLASRDTTAGALSFIFLELSRNPEILRKLRNEILETVGETERPSYENLKDMSYLRNVMNETLRLYPPVPFNLRTALCDTTLPRGGGADGNEPVGILAGTPIAYSPLVMQRREDLYPKEKDLPSPSEFNPERWTKWQPKPWHYIPFNGGPRICVGQQFALTEMAYTVVRILQQFDRIDGLTPREGPQFRCQIVISPPNGVQVGLWRSDN